MTRLMYINAKKFNNSLLPSLFKIAVKSFWKTIIVVVGPAIQAVKFASVFKYHELALFKSWKVLFDRPQLFKRWIMLSIIEISIHWIAQSVFLILIYIHWIVISPVDSAIRLLNHRGLINHYPLVNCKRNQ